MARNRSRHNANPVATNHLTSNATSENGVSIQMADTGNERVRALKALADAIRTYERLDSRSEAFFDNTLDDEDERRHRHVEDHLQKLLEEITHIASEAK